MLTCENLLFTAGCTASFAETSARKGDMVNLEKIQGPGTTGKLLRSTSSGKMHVVPKAVIEDVRTD